MDTIVTLEGRRQVASADLKIEYVSFTDTATYYKADLASGSADASERIYLEQCHLPQDQITFEADDSGRLAPFRNGSGITMKDGQILDYSFNALTASVLTGSNQGMRFLRGDEFASTAETLLASSIDNFNRLRLIGTKDKLFEDDGFGLGNKKVEFTIHNNRPLPDATHHVAHVNHLESLFQDVRLSKVVNFKYLPPINKVEDRGIDKRDHRHTWQHHLGYYKPWGRSHLYGLSPQQLEHELAHYERMGYAKTLVFEPTSKRNRLMGQFFEVHFNVMKKLDVIDYGWYTWHGARRHVFFAGKVLNDENGTHTFIHLFTFVFG
jgi:hypothetical protein